MYNKEVYVSYKNFIKKKLNRNLPKQMMFGSFYNYLVVFTIN